VSEAQDAGVLTALGPDWSPSGSKNLLGELKVARLVDSLNGGGLSDVDVIALATRKPGQDPALERARRLDRGRQARRPARRLRSNRRRARTPLHPQRARRGARHRQRRPPLRRETRSCESCWASLRLRRRRARPGAGPASSSLTRRPATRSSGKVSLNEATDLLADGLHRLCPSSPRTSTAEAEPGRTRSSCSTTRGRRRRSAAASPRSGRRAHGDGGRLRRATPLPTCSCR
jgi:hypothetical protein